MDKVNELRVKAYELSTHSAAPGTPAEKMVENAARILRFLTKGE